MPDRSPIKLVILDRDGTLNEASDDYIKSVDEWKPIPGALEAVARLNQAGWHVVLAANQSGLGRGLFDMSALNAIQHHLNEQLARLGGRIDALFFCPHAPEEGCGCRKPQPGLFHDIELRLGVDLSEVHAVGDALHDVQAGVAAGCKTHLVRTGRSAGLDDAGLARLLAQAGGPVEVHATLGAFVDGLLGAERRRALDAKLDAKRAAAGLGPGDASAATAPFVSSAVARAVAAIGTPDAPADGAALPTAAAAPGDGQSPGS